MTREASDLPLEQAPEAWHDREAGKQGNKQLKAASGLLLLVCHFWAL